LTKRKYLVLDGITGEYFDSYKFKQPKLEVKLTSSRLNTLYAIESDDILDEVNSRLALSQLSQFIFGTGFGTYRLQFYLIDDDILIPFGGIRSDYPKKRVRKLFSKTSDCMMLFCDILVAQLEYKSFARDGLIAALGQSRGSGFINERFAWTWWAFEWLLQNLGGLSDQLNYDATEDNGNTRKLREIFFTRFKLFLKDFESGHGFTIQSQKDQKLFENEMLSMMQMDRRQVLEPGVKGLFRSHSDFFKEALKNYFPRLTCQYTIALIQSWLDDWDKVIQLVSDAYSARNYAFHLGRYNGLLKNKDRYDRLREFNAFVSVLTSIILTKSPIEFDKMAEKNRFIDLPEQRIPPLEDGTLEWTTTDGFKAIAVGVEPFLYDEIALLSSEFIMRDSSSECVTDLRPPRDMLYSLEVDSFKFRGILHHTHNGHYRLKVMKWSRIEAQTESNGTRI